MVTHPFSRYRELAGGYSQDAVAIYLGTTRHYYLRLEQGLFHEVPENVAKSLVALFGVARNELLGAYRAYQRECREEFKSQYPSFKEKLSSYSGVEHPLVWYRLELELSRMGLCKGLCLHYDGVTQYEFNRQRGLPLDIKLACGDIYWDYSYLENAVIEWRSSGRADQLFKRTG